MNNYLLNNDVGTIGIYRCRLLLMSPLDSFQLEAIRAFIPGISNINPLNPDGSLNLEIYNNNKESFPKIQWCCYNENSKIIINPNAMYWCMFENGDIKRPVIINHEILMQS